jgi:hypothetical protein
MCCAYLDLYVISNRIRVIEHSGLHEIFFILEINYEESFAVGSRRARKQVAILCVEQNLGE